MLPQRSPSEYKRLTMSEESGHSESFSEEDESTGSTHGRSKSLWRCKLHHLLSMLLAVLLFIVFLLYQDAGQQLAPSQPETLHCGTTVAEAHARGCTFDAVAKHWLPPECPRYGLNEYLDAAKSDPRVSTNQWPFYKDKNMSLAVTLSDIGMMADLGENHPSNIWWSTASEHAVHCTWALLRTAYARTNGLRVDRVGVDFEHTKHCTFYLLDLALKAPGVETLPAFGNAAFGYC